MAGFDSSSLACFPAFGADVTGHWNFEGDVSGNPVKLECDLKQDGGKMEGSCKSPNGDVKLAGEVCPQAGESDRHA